MLSLGAHRCNRCRVLEQAHDQEMETYIRLVEQQSRMFRTGNVRAGRDLDAAIQFAKTKREAAIDALLTHSAHYHKA